MPKSRKFNAQECFFDIKFDQIHGEVKDIRRDPLKTPRGHRQVVTKGIDEALLPVKKRSSSCDEAEFKVIEFYSPTYLASVMLKQSASKSEENFAKLGNGLLDKSNDFNLLPY